MFSDFYISSPQSNYESPLNLNYEPLVNVQLTPVSQNKPTKTLPKNKIAGLKPQEILAHYKDRTPLFSATASKFNETLIINEKKPQASDSLSKNLSRKVAPVSKKRKPDTTSKQNQILNLSPKEIIDKYYRGRTPLFPATEASTFNEPSPINIQELQAGDALEKNLSRKVAPVSKKRELEENLPTNSTENLENLDNQDVTSPSKRQRSDVVTEQSPSTPISLMTFEDWCNQWLNIPDSETDIQQFELPMQPEEADIMDPFLHFDYKD